MLPIVDLETGEIVAEARDGPADFVGLDQIVALAECQPRREMDFSAIVDYADAMADGAEFPPLRAKRDGDVFYLYDGFHRRAAAERAGVGALAVAWEPGTRLDAIEASCSVNADQGLRRTNADKRKAVTRMFEVMTARGDNWSDSEIARRCAVSHTLVAGLRANLQPLQDAQMDQRTVTRGGMTYTQNVANIGQRKLGIVDLDTGAVISRPGPAFDDPEVRQSLVRGTLSTGLPANRVSEAMAAASLGRATVQPINSIRDSLASLNQLDPARALEAWIDAGEPSDLVGVLRQVAGAIDHFAELVEHVRSQRLRAVK